MGGIGRDYLSLVQENSLWGSRETIGTSKCQAVNSKGKDGSGGSAKEAGPKVGGLVAPAAALPTD